MKLGWRWGRGTEVNWGEVVGGRHNIHYTNADTINVLYIYI